LSLFQSRGGKPTFFFSQLCLQVYHRSGRFASSWPTPQSVSACCPNMACTILDLFCLDTLSDERDLISPVLPSGK
jgi:hypothetical protein